MTSQLLYGTKYALYFKPCIKEMQEKFYQNEAVNE